MVKKYSNVIKKLAENKFDDYMGGAMLPSYSGARIVSFIYGISIGKVRQDVEKTFNKICDTYYKNKIGNR